MEIVIFRKLEFVKHDGITSNSLQCDIAKTTFKQCRTVIANVEQCWTVRADIQKCWTVNMGQCWAVLVSVAWMLWHCKQI